MPFFSSLKKFSHPNLAHPASADVASDPSSGNSDELSHRRREIKPTPSLPRPWMRKVSSTVSGTSSSPSTEPALLIIPKVESPAPDAAVREMPTPMALPAGPGVFVTNLTMAHPTEMISTIGPVTDMLAETWDKVKDGPKGDIVDRSLKVLDDAIATVQNHPSPFTPLITAAASTVGQTDIGKAVKEGMDHFFDGMPVLMKALDELKSLHPFIGVVVLAFTTVYTLEQKRRDNEKKTIALYVEMKDMMGVLLFLRDVQGDKLIAPDGRSIEDRLKPLIECTADDIKRCSNVCDTYAKKKLLAKVFLGSVWDDKLLSWVTLFSKRRQEFGFELSIHTSQGVDKANVKLGVIGDTTRALDEKMNALKEIFERLEKTAIKSPIKSPITPWIEGHRAPWARPGDANPNADDLKTDIDEDPDVAVEKNQAVHSRKFEAQQRQIIDELNSAVRREGDRVIQELRGGPHERIRDRTVHEIWTEMGWRGNVKARHFVLALRDHYIEKLAAEAEGVPGIGTAAISSPQNPDMWAIKFIDVARLQPVLESFDDDASGFITISEMNRFTSSRPADWSLPHWVAFWAVGYRASIIYYANKIEELLAKMEGIRAAVLPPNRYLINNYINFCWHFLHSLTAAVTSLLPEPGTSNLDRFKSYLEAEEARLSTNLKDVTYVIDGTDTLTLITGVGRIEKTIFPLIYLLMKRHYEIMRAMRTKVLNPRELGSSVESFVNVYDAIRYRMNDLTNIFFQQKLDPEKQFQNFAHGIFKYFHKEKDLWTSDYVRSLDPPVISYNDTNEDQNVRLEDILKHEYKDELVLDDWVYDGHSIDDTPNYGDVEPPLKEILGHWHGYFYEDDGIRETSGLDSMMTFVLEPADGEHEFKANAWSNRGRYTITGSWSKGENDVTEIKSKMMFQGTLWSMVFFNGRFGSERDAITGIWGLSADAESASGKMEFRRIPPRYLTVYPSIKELSDNKARALWKFAIMAVRNDVRRKRWSWSYFAQRRDDRKTVISLGTPYLYFREPLDSEEIQRRCAASQRLTPGDACFYNSKIDHIRTNTWVHENIICDRCNRVIGGARLFCLDCDHKDTETCETLDLCYAQECMAARITDHQCLNVTHEPGHRLVKVRTVVLQRQYGRVYTAALVAFERVKTLCVEIAEPSQEKAEEGEVAGPDTKKPSTPESTPKESPSEPDERQQGDAPGDTTVKTKDDEGTSQGTRDKSLQDGTQAEDSDSPSCGKCKGRLSFPCWYCIYCEDNLFLCNACDREGVPELMRSSGKHTEDHHLIRCLAPEKDDDTTTPTERGRISLEGRLDNMQSRFDDLSQDLTSRIGNMVQLLHGLAAAMNARSSA